MAIHSSVEKCIKDATLEQITRRDVIAIAHTPLGYLAGGSSPRRFKTPLRGKNSVASATEFFNKIAMHPHSERQYISRKPKKNKKFTSS
jgi:hypothetical protein